jgi:hypothetical protein
MKKKALLLMLVLMFISTNIYAAFSFVDNRDGTVTDERTGLIWLKDTSCYEFQQNWDDAMSFAAALNDGECELTDGSDVGDWRLPSLEELQGIGTDPPATWGSGTPTEAWTTPSVPFLNVRLGYYWSSTNAGFGYAYSVSMSNGSSFEMNMLDNFYVWPVRDCLDIDQDGICDVFEEACCLPDETCADVTVGECESQGGLPQGEGTDCSGVVCEIPIEEACCLPDETCADVTVGECNSQGGLPQGEGTDCSEGECEEVSEDLCPDSNFEPNITIDGCDTGVSNSYVSDGCMLSDRIADCADEDTNHGQFVRCVAILTKALGISQTERKPIMKCTAHSGIGNDSD